MEDAAHRDARDELLLRLTEDTREPIEMERTTCSAEGETEYWSYSMKTHMRRSAREVRIFKGLAEAATPVEQEIWDFGRYYDQVRDPETLQVIYDKERKWVFDALKGVLYWRLPKPVMGCLRDD